MIADSPRIARYYRGARTTHLERLREMAPGTFFYLKPMYDFAVPALPEAVQVSQVRFREILRMVWRNEFDILEIVEPYAPSALPQTLALSFVSRLSRVRASERRTSLVTYAIENADLPAKFSRQFHLPLRVTTALLRLLVRYGFLSLDRIVYGTEDAERNYRTLLGHRVLTSHKAPEAELVWGLPAARKRSGEVRADRDLVVFLGAFDDRKGLSELLAAWPSVKNIVPKAELVVLGKGPKEPSVRRTVSTLDGVALVVDPEREEIWSQLERAAVLVLLSQPAPGWKEQIGLPIVEGLSVGLEIVASTETGIASWLADHGHRVLPPRCGVEDLATAVGEALREARPKEVIQAALPDRDGRLRADDWLMARP